MSAPNDELDIRPWLWCGVFYEKEVASQRVFVTLTLMTASTSERFLWRNPINGRDGEGRRLRSANNFSLIRGSEFFVRIAEGRQRAEGRTQKCSAGGSVNDAGHGSAAAPPRPLPSAF